MIHRIKIKNKKIQVSPLRGLARCFFVFLFLFPAIAGSVGVTTLMARSQQLQINETKSDEIAGRFLITNPSQVAIKVFISLGNSCNIQHFTKSDLSVPLDKITLRISGFADQVLWTRAGADCSSALEWIPSGPFLDNYTIDVLVDWDGSFSPSLAGTYSESITVVAIEL